MHDEVCGPLGTIYRTMLPGGGQVRIMVGMCVSVRGKL